MREDALTGERKRHRGRSISAIPGRGYVQAEPPFTIYVTAAERVYFSRTWDPFGRRNASAERRSFSSTSSVPPARCTGS